MPTQITTPERPASRTRDFMRILILVSVIYVVSTLIDAVTGLKIKLLLKEKLHLSANAQSTFFLFLALPAYCQFFFGALADMYPLFGYHRRSYFVLGTVIVAAAFLGLATLRVYHYATVACLILIAGVGGVMRGVIINAVMVSVGNRTGTFGRLQSVSQFFPLVLAIVYTSNLSGYVAQNWSYPRAFTVGAILCLLKLLVLPLMDDKRTSAAQQTHETDDEHKARREARKADRARTKASLRTAIMTPGLWAMVAFIFYLIITPGLGTAQTYYTLDVLRLSSQFLGDLGQWGAWGSLIGIIGFMLVSRKLPIWSLVWGAWLMDCLGYPVMMFYHDAPSAHWTTLIGSTIGVIYGLCLYTLAARACPPGIEGAVYGMVMAAIALAGNFSDKFGSMLYDFFGPSNKAHPYTTAHGWYTGLWFGFGFTVLAIIFIPFLPAWTRSRETLHAQPESVGGEAQEAPAPA